MPTGTAAQYNRAVEVIRAAGSVSIPLLKRELNIAWLEAAQLVSLMELRGVIGPFDGMKPREIRAVEKPPVNTDAVKVTINKMHEYNGGGWYYRVHDYETHLPYDGFVECFIENPTDQEVVEIIRPLVSLNWPNAVFEVSHYEPD